jgi:hypothetical protein
MPCGDPLPRHRECLGKWLESRFFRKDSSGSDVLPCFALAQNGTGWDKAQGASPLQRRRASRMSTPARGRQSGVIGWRTASRGGGPH